MPGKRKKRKYNMRKLRLFVILAVIAALLPVGLLLRDARPDGKGAGAASDSRHTDAQSFAATPARQSGEPGGDEVNGEGDNDTDSGYADGEDENSVYVDGEGDNDTNSSYADGEGESGVYEDVRDDNNIDSGYAGGEGDSDEYEDVGGAYANGEEDAIDAAAQRHDIAYDGRTDAALSDSSQKAILLNAPAGGPADGFTAAEANAGADADFMRYMPNGNIVVTISAIGDCTIGYDETFGYQGRFDQVYAANGGNPAYFFENVLGILSSDDITVANLETVFTDSRKKASKTYRFRGPPEYVKILEAGGVDAVNIANNHMYDYFQKGFDDTVNTLKESTLEYFGYDVTRIIDARGVRVGFAGFHIGGGGWSGKKKAVAQALETLRAEADLVVMSFHWGIEGQYKPSGDQKSLAKFCIDNGADLVLGHHPHTLQPIETYKGRTVAYSLGNFCFGGNRNPKDKDSVILRQSFEFDPSDFSLLEAREPEIIPVLISSAQNRNDYRPTPAEGDAAARIMKKVSPK